MGENERWVDEKQGTVTQTQVEDAEKAGRGRAEQVEELSGGPDKSRRSGVAGDRTPLLGCVQSSPNHWGEDPYWEHGGDTYALRRLKLSNSGILQGL